METNQEVLQTYIKNGYLLDAYVDVFSTHFTKITKLISKTTKAYNKHSERLLKDPIAGRMHKKIDGITDLEEQNRFCTKLNTDLVEYIDLFVQSVLSSAKVKDNAEYFCEEALHLANAYEFCCDEGYYVEVDDRVLLEREKRIFATFDKLSSSEIEKEYLLLYNAYNSRCSYVQALVERVVEHKRLNTAIKITADVMDELERGFPSGIIRFLEDGGQELMHSRKDKFLGLFTTMSHEALEACYKEMCDIMLAAMLETKMYLQSLRHVCTQEECELIRSETKSFVEMMHFPDRVSKNMEGD